MLKLHILLKMKRILSVVFFIIWTCGVNAQYYDKILKDSLQLIVDNPKTKDAERIDPLARLSRQYMNQGDSAVATELINKARTLAMREKDSKYMIYVYNQELINCLKAFPKKITRAYQIIDSIYIAIKKTSDPEAQALGYDYIGSAKYGTNPEYDLDDYFKSLAIAEKLPETSAKKYRILYDIYVRMYAKSLNTDKTSALKYMNLLQQAAEKSGDTGFLCSSKHIKLKFDLLNSRNDKNLISQEFATLDKFISENINKVEPGSYGRSVFTLIESYSAIPDDKYKKKLENYIETFRKIADNTVDCKMLLLAVEIHYSTYVQNNYTEALNLLYQKIKIDEINYPGDLVMDYELLAAIYSETNQYKQATEAWRNCVKYLLQYHSAKSDEQHQLAEVKFGVDKKEQQIKQQQSKILFISIPLVLVIIILMTLVWLLNNQRRINKLEKEKAQLIAQQKEADKHRLSKELIIHTNELNRKNRLIGKAKDMDKDQLDRALRYEQKKVKLTSDYIKLFNEANSEYFKRLQQQAHPNKLSSADLKYCAYISLRMSNKELANIMDVEYNSVVMHKYRLKRKLNLSENEDLEKFIIDIIPSS